MKIVGMVIGLAGALVVILSNSGTTAATAKLGGDAIVFLGIVSSSFSMVWLKDLIMRYKPITLLRWMYPLAALMLLPFGLSSVIHTDFAAIPPHIWWVIAYAVLLPSFGPNYLLIFSLHYVKPTISSVYFYLQPVIATGLSVALGMDKLSWDRGLNPPAEPISHNPGILLTICQKIAIFADYCKSQVIETWAVQNSKSIKDSIYRRSTGKFSNSGTATTHSTRA